MEKVSEEFKALAEAWEYPIVLHRDIERFTAGAMSRARLSSHYQAGRGPKSFRIGNKLASNKEEMARWLESYTKSLPSNQKQ